MPERLAIVVPGGLLVSALGLGAAFVSVHSFLSGVSTSLVVFFVGTVLASPIFLVLVAWARWPDPFPSETLALAVVALCAVPVHPIYRRTWAAVITIIGLFAWLFCSIIVAGAPA